MNKNVLLTTFVFIIIELRKQDQEFQQQKILIRPVGYLPKKHKIGLKGLCKDSCHVFIYYPGIHHTDE